MKINRPRFLAFVLSAVLPVSSWCVGPVVVADSLSLKDVVTGPIKIGRRTVVLPAGSWQLFEKSERTSNADGPSQSATLMDLEFQEIKNDRISRILHIVATKTSHTANWLDDPCKSKGNSYWMEDRKRGMNDQFCLRVDYLSGVVDAAHGAQYETWARDIKAKAIGYSPDMPFVSVIRYTSYDYLRMAMAFDPSSSGITPSKTPARQFNDWNGVTVSQMPVHRKFYDALVSWAPRFADAVQRAFDGDESLSDADYGEPILPTKAQ